MSYLFIRRHLIIWMAAWETNRSCAHFRGRILKVTLLDGLLLRDLDPRRITTSLELLENENHPEVLCGSRGIWRQVIFDPFGSFPPAVEWSIHKDSLTVHLLERRAHSRIQKNDETNPLIVSEDLKHQIDYFNKTVPTRRTKFPLMSSLSIERWTKREEFSQKSKREKSNKVTVSKSQMETYSNPFHQKEDESVDNS